MKTQCFVIFEAKKAKKANENTVFGESASWPVGGVPGWLAVWLTVWLGGWLVGWVGGWLVPSFSLWT